jgi:hypothetical protein
MLLLLLIVRIDKAHQMIYMLCFWPVCIEVTLVQVVQIVDG